MRNVTNVKKLQKKARRLEVRPGRTRWQCEVKSGSSDEWYAVTFNRDWTDATCSCEWAQYGGRNCSHVQAALDWAHEEGRVSYWLSEEDAARQHRHGWQVNDGLWATVRA